MDDFCAINDGLDFGRTNEEIYPTEVELKLEYQVNHLSLLNLDFFVVGGQSFYKLYDKRDSFLLLIVIIPHTLRNLPNNTFYSAIFGEAFKTGIRNSTFR